ncbi:MAG: hypothetical protein QXF15_01540 [Candidatus Aenigmatarchaeota archaeon]|nr:hypothetical protein [Candidatus Aenigmarchaeota archaeon]
MSLFKKNYEIKSDNNIIVACFYKDITNADGTKNNESIELINKKFLPKIEEEYVECLSNDKNNGKIFNNLLKKFNKFYEQLDDENIDVKEFTKVFKKESLDNFIPNFYGLSKEFCQNRFGNVFICINSERDVDPCAKAISKAFIENHNFTKEFASLLQTPEQETKPTLKDNLKEGASRAGLKVLEKAVPFGGIIAGVIEYKSNKEYYDFCSKLYTYVAGWSFYPVLELNKIQYYVKKL